MWMQTGCCEGYKVRGLKEQREGGWRITTWPEGKDKPENCFWVKDGVFYKAGLYIAPSHTEWQRAEIGPLDTDVKDEEKFAVVTLIDKWDAQISPSSPPEQE
jgi:hypothetical protein